MRTNHSLLAAALFLSLPGWAPFSALDLGVLSVSTVSVASTEVLAQATAPTLDEVVERLQATYDGMTDYSADFTQVHRNLAAGSEDTLTGTVYFLRPGMMRWDYQAPHVKYLITDGDTFWSVDAHNGQYYEADLEATQLPTALRFLMGEGQLADDFEISFADEPSTQSAELRLVPREPTGDYDHLVFSVHVETGRLDAVRIMDALGNENAFSFASAQFDGGFDASSFRYVPGPDMTRIEEPN